MPVATVPLSADLTFRRLVFQVTEPTLLARCDREPLTLYAGFDPTAPSLHVGNLLTLCTLRRFQAAGHRPIALAGGGTGLIGDPGGKASERPLLAAEELAANLEGIRPQLARFLDFDPKVGPSQALLLDNAAWLGQMSAIGFLRDVGKHFTVNQMMAKESVRSRLDRPEQGISYTEFSYMLLQAYDFLRLRCDYGCVLQIGGSDQWGNITMGVELVRKTGSGEVFGLTTPLVTRPDGAKFGKTEQGTVWLDAARTSPFRLYQFFVNSDDASVGDYLRYFTFLDHEAIGALDDEVRDHPERRGAARVLAAEVCALVHGPEARRRAEQASEALFGGAVASLDAEALEDVAGEVGVTEVGRGALEGGTALVDLLAVSGLAPSKGEARRAVTQGGVYLNDVRMDDAERGVGVADLLHDRYLVLRRGRRTYHLVRAR